MVDLIDAGTDDGSGGWILAAEDEQFTLHLFTEDEWCAVRIDGSAASVIISRLGVDLHD